MVADTELNDTLETRYSVRVTVICDNYAVAMAVQSDMEEAAGKHNAELIESNIE